MGNIFNSIPLSKLKKSAFNLSHEVKLTAGFGQLTPFLVQPVIPGDIFKCSNTYLLRTMPLIAPIMHRVNVYMHYFFVPNRIVWNDWEDFITGGEDGTAKPIFPRMYVDDPTRWVKGTLWDYLGYPVRNKNESLAGNAANGPFYSVLPYRAFTQIYNDYYRDQNLQPELWNDKTSGITKISQYSHLLPYRCWSKDYFTSSLPWTQRNAYEPTVPSVNTLSVGYQNRFSDRVYRVGTGDYAGGNLTAEEGELTSDQVPVSVDNSSNLKIDGDITFNINDLRTASALQRWMEKSARVGSRYVEQLRGFFGVVSDDARLQRAEFLGGGRCPVSIGEIPQTSGTDSTSDTAQGNLAGKGIAVNSTPSFKRKFKEHGYIIGILSIMPKPSYQQGCPREYMKFSKFDFYFPEFDHLGEQPIYEREIFDSPKDVTSNDKVFGYTPRYAEYRYNPNRVCGEFRDTLAFWHLGRSFANAPALNASFITPKQELERLNSVFAVTDSSNSPFLLQILNDVKAIRPMSKYGTPKLL